MPNVERQRELRRRRQRRMKVRLLRKRLMETKDVRTRAKLLQKITQISPQAPVPSR
jgi:hypothetical protein